MTRPGRGDAVEAAGRAGLVARGLVYVVVAVLAALVAFGRKRAETNQTGALATIGDRPYGQVLLGVLAICLLGYAGWRAAEAISGRTSKDPDAGWPSRASSAGKALTYGSIAVTAFRLAQHHPKSGGQSQQTFTAKVLEWPGGPVLVGLAGAAVLVMAANQFRSAITGSFLKRLHVSKDHEGAVRTIGTVGHVGRGVAFALVGAFVIRAAIEHDPSKSRGLDGALQEVAGKGYGPPLLLLLAVGVLAFGLYSFAEARWRRIRA